MTADDPAARPRSTPAPAPEVAALFGDATCFELWGPGDHHRLQPAEWALVEGAVAGRVGQFAAGRHCAHAALAALGVDGPPIGRAAQRAPAWPPGVRGTIAHTDHYAVAAATLSPTVGIGVDAEIVGRVTPELHPRLFTLADRQRLTEGGPERSEDELATIWFGLKEAYYKAQFPLTAAWVGFHDVEIRPAPSGGPGWILEPATDLAALAAVEWPVRGGAAVRGDLVVAGVEVTPARS